MSIRGQLTWFTGSILLTPYIIITSYRYSGIYYVLLYQASFYLVDAISFVEAYLCF